MDKNCIKDVFTTENGFICPLVVMDEVAEGSERPLSGKQLDVLQLHDQLWKRPVTESDRRLCRVNMRRGLFGCLRTCHLLRQGDSNVISLNVFRYLKVIFFNGRLSSFMSLYIHNVKQVFLIYLLVQNQNLQASKLLKILPYSLVITSSAFLFFRG